MGRELRLPRGTFFLPDSREDRALTIVPSFRLLTLASLALCAGMLDLQAAPTQAQQQAIRSSCQNDYRSYCASVPTGGAAALQCLEKNVASLSPSCQQAVRAATGRPAATGTESGGTAAGTPPAGASGAPESKGPAVVVIQPGQ